MNTIKSFVRRSGRTTKGQKNALINLWSKYGIDLPVGTVNFDTIFTKKQPIILEIGFGNGNNLLHLAKTMTYKNFLGIEVYNAGIGHLLLQAYKHKINNLKIIKADAYKVLKYHIKNNTITGMQLFFPDPWHKKKQKKRRIIQAEFLNLAHQKIINSGTMHIATDWQDYAEQILKLISLNANFKKTNYAQLTQRSVTKFEKRGIKLGHNIWDLFFTNEK